MNSEKLEESLLNQKLEKLNHEVVNLAHECEGDVLLLIKILRQLESIHRQIREDLFDSSLPDTRHGLYSLLKDIDETGGWPYIERMKLQYLCEKFLKVATDAHENQD